jgi:hypothetical protein
MSPAKRGDTDRSRPGRSANRVDKARFAPLHYVVFRATTYVDGSTTSHYDVPGTQASLDEPGFAAWLRDHVPDLHARDLVSVLVIRELLDGRGLIETGCLERRRGSATGAFHGEPARVTFTGAVAQVRFYRATARGTLREMTPSLDRAPSTPSRQVRLAGDAQVVRNVFGAAARILDMRSPTVLEDLIGLSSIVHLRTQDDIETDCGLGWHGTTPFVLRADFPRFGAPPDLPAAEAAAADMAAITAGLSTFEIRGDENGPAMVARSRRDGAFHLIRPAAGGARVEAYTPGVPDALLTADQALWVRYAREHEHLTLIDAYRDGGSDNVFVVAGAPDGGVTRHLIDADGVEVWRAAADDTAVGGWYRERTIGPERD